MAKGHWCTVKGGDSLFYYLSEKGSTLKVYI